LILRHPAGAGAAPSSIYPIEAIEKLTNENKRLALAVQMAQAHACRTQQEGDLVMKELRRLWQLCLHHGLDPAANSPVMVPTASIVVSGQPISDSDPASEPDGSSNLPVQDEGSTSIQLHPVEPTAFNSVANEVEIDATNGSGTVPECGVRKLDVNESHSVADEVDTKDIDIDVTISSGTATECGVQTLDVNVSHWQDGSEPFDSFDVLGSEHIDDLLLLDSLSPAVLLSLLTQYSETSSTQGALCASAGHGESSHSGQGIGAGHCALSACQTLPTQISSLAHGGNAYRSAEFQAAQTNKRWWALVVFSSCWIFSYQRVIQVLILVR